MDSLLALCRRHSRPKSICNEWSFILKHNTRIIKKKKKKPSPLRTRIRFVSLISLVSCGTVVKIKRKKIDASTQDGSIFCRWSSRDRWKTTRTRGECNNKLKYGFQISCLYFIMGPRGRWRVTTENLYNIVWTVLQPPLPLRTISVNE